MWQAAISRCLALDFFDFIFEDFVVVRDRGSLKALEDDLAEVTGYEVVRLSRSVNESLVGCTDGGNKLVDILSLKVGDLESFEFSKESFNDSR